VVDALREGVAPGTGTPIPAAEVGEEAAALLALGELPGVGFVTLERLLAAFGSGRGALEAPGHAFHELAGDQASAARSEVRRLEEARAMVLRARGLGMHVVPRGAEGYPARLLHLAQPPAVLFLRGDASLLHRPMVAVVGSRRSSAYGRRVAAEVARVLCAHGVVVSSGLALGVDAAAHRGALEAGGATLAVLGSGADVPHPPSNRGLFERVGREGLLVSEFALGTLPLPHHFPQRNRILAALAEGVLVVEAARRSGALITSDLALELGRSIMAVPGPVFADRSRGTNRLIRQGAAILSEPADVLELVALAAAPGLEAEAPPGPVGLGPDAAALWSALAAGGLAVDDLSRGSGLDPARALSALAGMELAGWVEREPGMRFVRRGGGGVPRVAAPGGDPSGVAR
jgi:DNA processing protein